MFRCCEFSFSSISLSIRIWSLHFGFLSCILFFFVDDLPSNWRRIVLTTVQCAPDFACAACRATDLLVRKNKVILLHRSWTNPVCLQEYYSYVLHRVVFHLRILRFMSMGCPCAERLWSDVVFCIRIWLMCCAGACPVFCGGLFSPLPIQVVTTSFLVVFPLVSISRLLRLVVVVVVVDCSSSVYLWPSLSPSWCRTLCKSYVHLIWFTNWKRTGRIVHSSDPRFIFVSSGVTICSCSSRLW